MRRSTPALQRLAIVLLAASLFAVLAGIFLARRMVGPIQALRAGAERIGSGDFAQRISIRTGDELEGLANQFNEMGARLQESYADLEKKVEQRTAELSESLEQQTASATCSRSSAVRHSIWSRSATRWCRPRRASATPRWRFILHREGELYLAGAAVRLLGCLYQISARAIRSLPIAENTGRAALERHAVQILDVATDPEYTMSESDCY